jgi:hypothetical protein
VSPQSGQLARGLPSLNQAPLRRIANREVLASRERLFLSCGHAIERRYGGFAYRARCAECQAEGRS